MELGWRSAALANDWREGQAWHYFLYSGAVAQVRDLTAVQFLGAPAQQSARQLNGAIANAFQAADHQALRFPHPADFAIAAFAQNDAEP